MLSRSESWGSAAETFQTGSTPSGAVFERPVWERLFGVTFSRGSGEGWRVGAPWCGLRVAFDLTDGVGEVFFGAFEGGDMESTLVRPSRRPS
jgi:hypothetical protein